MKQTFTCGVCGYVGMPIHGIEMDPTEPDDLRQFVGCDNCGARHEVRVTDVGAERRFEVVNVYPEDRRLKL